MDKTTNEEFGALLEQIGAPPTKESVIAAWKYVVENGPYTGLEKTFAQRFISQLFDRSSGDDYTHSSCLKDVFIIKYALDGQNSILYAVSTDDVLSIPVVDDLFVITKDGTKISNGRQYIEPRKMIRPGIQDFMKVSSLSKYVLNRW